MIDEYGLMSTDQQVIYAAFNTMMNISTSIQTYKADGRYNKWFNLVYLARDAGLARKIRTAFTWRGHIATSLVFFYRLFIVASTSKPVVILCCSWFQVASQIWCNTQTNWQRSNDKELYYLTIAILFRPLYKVVSSSTQLRVKTNKIVGTVSRSRSNEMSMNSNDKVEKVCKVIS